MTTRLDGRSHGGHAAEMRRNALVLAIVATDATFERVELRDGWAWRGKCIHCNAKLVVSLAGDTQGATVEHIVPSGLGGTDALDNVALACQRCNNLKGKRLDTRCLTDPVLQEVIATLRARRQARWRPSNID